MDAAELTKFLEDNKEEFNNALKKKVIDSMTQRLQWDFPDLIQKQVKEFYETELRPEVEACLKDNKGALMAVVTQASVDAAQSIAIAMAEQVKKTMDPSNYRRAEIFKALFDYR